MRSFRSRGETPQIGRQFCNLKEEEKFLEEGEGEGKGKKENAPQTFP